MGYVKSKYSKEHTAEIRVLALGVLAEAERALTIEEICGRDMGLIHQTQQKMARELNQLAEFGFVAKSKNSAGRVTYAAVGSGYANE